VIPTVFDQTSHGYPPSGWPSKDALDYTQKLVTVLLLLLALPWLVYKLVTDPGRVLAGAAKKQAGAA
jgi:flagellar biogenesis protein FliO